MIYQDVKRFLKRHLQKPLKDREWSGHDNLLLLSFIQDRYTDEQIQHNISEIRQAFRDFFEPIGNIIVRFKEDTGVAYKIFPYHIRPQDSKHLHSLIKIIHKNRRYIEYPYNNREDQIALKGKIRRHINAEIIETKEAVNKKELVRLAIKKALELDERDVIIQLKRKYIIKIFQRNSYLNPNALQPQYKDESERRFGGYNAEDLGNHYNELLNDIDLESFLDDVMAQLFVEKLNFDEINNDYYEKNVLSLIRYKIASELEQYISKNEDYLLGFAGYIFRHNFESLHERIAIELFELIAHKNKNAEKFLNYYTGKVFIENGNRYVIPEITTKDGKHWNINSIMAIAKMWLRARDEEDRLKIKYENINVHFVDLEDEYKEIKGEYTDLDNQLKVLRTKFAFIEDDISRIMKNFKSELRGTMNEKKELELSLRLKSTKSKQIEIKRDMQLLQPQKDTLRYKYKSLESQYLDIKKQKQTLETNLRTLRQNLNVKSDSFHSILGSFVKALMKRKELVSN